MVRDFRVELKTRLIHSANKVAQHKASALPLATSGYNKGMASSNNQKLGTRAKGNMARRLELLNINAKAGNPPTVAQISAAYATMATAPIGYGEEQWGSLLSLAQVAIGVLDTCCQCGGGGAVSQPHKPDVKTGVKLPGFERVTCAVYEDGEVVQNTCFGSGWRRIHNPAPGELPGNLSAQHANLSNMQQVAKVLNGVLA